MNALDHGDVLQYLAVIAQQQKIHKGDFMKNAFLALTALVLFAGPAMAADLCRAKALLAAEDYYGNDPKGTSVHTLVAGQSYVVSVGRGNAEDGEHTYSVNFPNGCESQPSITEINQ